MDDADTPLWCDHVWPTGASCEGRANWSVSVPNGTPPDGGTAASRGRLVCDGHLYESMMTIARSGQPIAVRRIPREIPEG
jgi:hypothetical protein